MSEEKINNAILSLLRGTLRVKRAFCTLYSRYSYTYVRGRSSCALLTQAKEPYFILKFNLY